MTNTYITPDDVAVRCEQAKQRGQGWSAACPAHDDKQASLSINPGRKGTLVYCHAGCKLDDILNELGLRREQLFYDYKDRRVWDEHGMDAGRLMAEMLKQEHGSRLKSPIVAVDDVMWHALVTPVVRDKVGEDSMERAMAMAGVEFPLYMDLEFEEAMTYHAVFRDGPLFTFMRPVWEAAKRPNWHDFAAQCFKAMHAEYRKRAGR